MIVEELHPLSIESCREILLRFLNYLLSELVFSVCEPYDMAIEKFHVAYIIFSRK